MSEPHTRNQSDWLGALQEDSVVATLNGSESRSSSRVPHLPPSPEAASKPVETQLEEAEPPKPRGKRIPIVIGVLAALLALETIVLGSWIFSRPTRRPDGVGQLKTAEAAAASADAPAEVVVSASGGEFRSIQEAIGRVRPGGKVRLKPGTYTGKIVLDRPVELVGEGPRDGVVLASPTGVPLIVKSEHVTVRGVTVSRQEGVDDPQGYAIEVTAAGTVLEDLDISSRSAHAVMVHGGLASVSMRNCRIHDTKGAGIVAGEGARVDAENCEVAGGGETCFVFREESIARLRSCKAHDSKLNGLFARDRSSVHCEDCDFTANTKDQIALQGGASLVLVKCRIKKGLADGVWISKSAAELHDCEIDGHVTNGLYAQEGRVTIRGGSVANCKKTGLLFVEKVTATVDGCDISECEDGNIAFRDSSTGTVSRCKVHGGKVGAIIRDGSGPTFEHCEIFGCKGIAASVFKDSRPVFRHCKFSQNESNAVNISEKSGGLYEHCEFGPHKLSVAYISGEGCAPTFDDCTFNGGERYALSFTEGAGGLVYRCTITGMKFSGVLLDDPQGKPVIKECTIKDCSVAAIVFQDDGRGTIIGGEFSGNKVATIGGKASEAELIRCKLLGGPGIGVSMIEKGRVMLTECEIRDYDKEAVSISGTVEISLTRCQISGGKGIGFYARNTATATLAGCTITGTTLDAVYAREEAALTLKDCTLKDGKASAVKVTEAARVHAVGGEVAGFEASGFSGTGGEVTIDRTTITKSKFSGVFAGAKAKATVRDATISDCGYAGVTARGGGVRVNRCKLIKNTHAIWAYEDGRATVNECIAEQPSGTVWKMESGGLISGTGNVPALLGETPSPSVPATPKTPSPFVPPSSKLPSPFEPSKGPPPAIPSPLFPPPKVPDPLAPPTIKP